MQHLSTPTISLKTHLPSPVSCNTYLPFTILLGTYFLSPISPKTLPSYSGHIFCRPSHPRPYHLTQDIFSIAHLTQDLTILLRTYFLSPISPKTLPSYSGHIFCRPSHPRPYHLTQDIFSVAHLTQDLSTHYHFTQDTSSFSCLMLRYAFPL